MSDASAVLESRSWWLRAKHHEHHLYWARLFTFSSELSQETTFPAHLPHLGSFATSPPVCANASVQVVHLCVVPLHACAVRTTCTQTTRD
eukprot:8639301-Pyramimonas_sp.AAC.1